MDIELIKRRLLLAKEFYHHALERSLRTDAVNKMMAIHNFHIAVEIALKAILLKYEIRSEKTLNIDFESMMGEIDKSAPEKLSYRQEMRTLNQLRGLIQHQGIEPDKSSMEEFRVLTKKFLETTYSRYFDLNFENLSRISLISDDFLKNLLLKSEELSSKNQLTEAAVRAIVAFQLASNAVTNFLPNEGFNSSFFITSRLRHSELNLDPIIKGFEDTFTRIKKSEKFAATLGSGVSLTDLKRLEVIPVHVNFSINGSAIIHQQKDSEIEKGEIDWAIDFVTSCILLWQQKGLEPEVSDSVASRLRNQLIENTASDF